MRLFDCCHTNPDAFIIDYVRYRTDTSATSVEDGTQININLKGLIMHWEHIENNWEEFKGTIKQNWDEISYHQLRVVAGKRERFSKVIQRTYGVGRSEAEHQLSDWQNSQINNDGHFYTTK